MRDKLLDDLRLRRVVSTIPQTPFFSSPLGFAPERDGGLRRIQPLSSAREIRKGIPEIFASLDYVTFHAVLDMIVQAGRSCVIMKRDIKDAFRKHPASPRHPMVLRISLGTSILQGDCLPFSLRTAPFIFKGFHWILQSYLNWEFLAHYLDDFINVIPWPLLII
jgi:hypothetical protein